MTILTSSAGSPAGAPNKSRPAQAAESEPKLTNPHEVHEAIRGLKVSKAHEPERYPEAGLEAYSPASDFLPGPDLQCGSSYPSLYPSVETRSNDLYP